MNPRSTRSVPSELKETIAPARIDPPEICFGAADGRDLFGQAVELCHDVFGSILAVLGDEHRAG